MRCISIHRTHQIIAAEALAEGVCPPEYHRSVKCFAGVCLGLSHSRCFCSFCTDSLSLAGAVPLYFLLSHTSHFLSTLSHIFHLFSPISSASSLSFFYLVPCFFAVSSSFTSQYLRQVTCSSSLIS